MHDCDSTVFRYSICNKRRSRLLFRLPFVYPRQSNIIVGLVKDRIEMILTFVAPKGSSTRTGGIRKDASVSSYKDGSRRSAVIDKEYGRIRCQRYVNIAISTTLTMSSPTGFLTIEIMFWKKVTSSGRLNINVISPFGRRSEWLLFKTILQILIPESGIIGMLYRWHSLRYRDFDRAYPFRSRPSVLSPGWYWKASDSFQFVVVVSSSLLLALVLVRSITDKHTVFVRTILASIYRP